MDEDDSDGIYGAKVNGVGRKDWAKGRWTGFGGCVIWLLKVVLCWKTGDLL